MKKAVGLLGIILGGLFLSLEILLLKVIQGLHMVYGTWFTHSLAYALDTTCLLALLITAGVIVFSVVLYRRGD